MSALLLYFADEQAAAARLARACALPMAAIACHRFPDDELKLTLPGTGAGDPPDTMVIYRGLDRPNEKLVELLLVARHARQLGVRRLLLVTPYLGYMRQDIAFQPGEIVSQKIIGGFLAELFDGLITVDPHLHRISRLQQAVPLADAIALSAAPSLAELVVQRRQQPLLVGPDAESAQWVESAARAQGLDYAVCSKVRHGDTRVEIALPAIDVSDRAIVLLDDVASSGRTLAAAARLLLAAGARSVDVAVTHALFAGDALQVMAAAGVGEVWSTDCIAHPSNAVPMAPLLAAALLPLL
ncbi:ribose-phosphate diphosphokinase [Haliea sp. E1-2-M8]|uniref:ribose-phosphate diphosphokinase n=1 Tax=Haliea sp. E1-2-M8 TaxID=3064706 RepID=UPI002725E565|nr:ribose-phosphate diphosphokinase [Haliea sp. E1-2-M8]MDO8862694.1 ribose-phosphate diphosphokinase [Haliea sp. E1-2-M8]